MPVIHINDVAFAIRAPVTGLNNTTSPVTFTVPDATVFGQTSNVNSFPCRVNNEWLLCNVNFSGGVAVSLTATTRGYSGTTPVAHADGSILTVGATAESIKTVATQEATIAAAAAVAGLTPYSLPIAGATVLGGIKIGANLTVNPATGVVDAAAGGSSSPTFPGTAGETISTFPSVVGRDTAGMHGTRGYFWKFGGTADGTRAFPDWGIATAVSSGTLTLYPPGSIVDGFTGLTAGQDVWADPATPGGWTQSQPAMPALDGTHQVYLCIGTAISATQVATRDNPVMVRAGKTLANAATFDLTHYYDGSKRRLLDAISLTDSEKVAMGGWTANSGATTMVLNKLMSVDSSDQTTKSAFKNGLSTKDFLFTVVVPRGIYRPPPFNIKLLMVAGGGGPGTYNWGNVHGGGGGQVLENLSYDCTASVYNVTIGDGGTPFNDQAVPGGPGGNTLFGSLTVYGGAGGSGGGSNVQSGNAGGPSGMGTGPAGDTNGHGGGAGGAATGSARGAGVASSVGGSSYTYSPGGDTSNWNGTTTIYGAGGSHSSTAPHGGGGGSGIVIIEYPSATALATGGTITTYVSGGITYQVHTFTSSGTFTIN